MNHRFHLALAVLSILGTVVPSPAQEAEPVYKTKFRVINVHRHSAIATDEAVRAEFEAMDRVGLAVDVILDGDSPAGSLAAWLKLKKKYPDRLVIFRKISFDHIKEPRFFDDLVRDLERSAKEGVQGIKVWKDLGMYIRDGSGKLLKADDPRLDPLWAKCGELGLPILMHVADPKEYWYPLTYNSFHYGLRAEKDQHYSNPEMPRWEELIRQRDSILKKHPKTQIIGAHMGSLTFDLKELGETLDKYPNFTVDCAARLRILGRLNPPAVRDFFTKYQDRILFGTDNQILYKTRKPSNTANISVYPSDDSDWMTIDPSDKEAVERWKVKAARFYSDYLAYFETDRVDIEDPNHSGGAWLRLAGAKLPPEVLEKLYHKNAERLIPGLGKK